MKELTLEEVLRIAGGVPPSAALDELTYRAPEDKRGCPAVPATPESGLRPVQGE